MFPGELLLYPRSAYLPQILSQRIVVQELDNTVSKCPDVIWGGVERRTLCRVASLEKVKGERVVLHFGG